jgi:hypothetical protein
MNENNYGFIFNDITIHNNLFNKKSKNLFGKIKINNEINFYLFIIENNIDFPMPKLTNHEDGILTLEYVSNSYVLTNEFNINNLNNLNIIRSYIDKIKIYLYNIHSIQKQVSSNTIKKDLILEVEQKVLTRFNEFEWNNNALFNSIQSVNNIKINNISYYCNIIKTKLLYHLKNRDYYNIIHGDIHLGNILLDTSNNIFFIDPRGYFGESKLFGLYEYDYAKLLFGLSGYSIFDNMNINELHIINNNIEIDFIKQYEFIFEQNIFDNITILLCLSIWLANNSCFSNINKKITSLMIAYYYCEKYIDF